MKNDKGQAPYNDLIGDMLNNQEGKGQIDHLPGAGKPLSKAYLSGDTYQHFQRIAKDAGYIPHWLRLQHEIRDDVLALKELAQTSAKETVEAKIEDVNEKIKAYNQVCPAPMQRAPVTVDQL